MSIIKPIAQLLGYILDILFMGLNAIGIGNIAIAIIIFTLLVKMLMLPLQIKQQKMTKLQSVMNPEIKAIQEKYKGKNSDTVAMQKMQAETKAVYEKYGVSMMGSCVQMLIEMPLLFALYRVFLNVPAYVSGVKNNFSTLVDGIMATSGYQDKMTQLVTDLRVMTTPAADFTVSDPTALSNSIVDVLYKMNSAGWENLKSAFPSLTDTINATYDTVSHVNNFLGLNISDTPWQVMTTNFASHNFLFVVLALLVPVISYLTQVLNIKLMPQAAPSNGNSDNDMASQQMKMMNRTMPIFSFVMCFTVPVGLGIYWIAGAVVRSVQQFFLNKHFEKINLEDIIKKNQEKAKKKREKMGIAENQISNAAKINTRKIDEPKKEEKKSNMSEAQRELELEKANAAKSKAKAGSMAAKANMVRDFNEKNSRK